MEQITQPPWVFDDGGRAAAGYKGFTEDCACRAIAVATALPYQEAYDLIIEAAKRERMTKRKTSRSHPRTGVHKATMRRIMDELGWVWTPTMQVGQGCAVHLRPDELPAGRLIVAVTKHYTVVIDGVIRDTHDPSRGGTRCVYGHWRPQAAS